jgi:hypothetical protein
MLKALILRGLVTLPDMVSTLLWAPFGGEKGPWEKAAEGEGVSLLPRCPEGRLLGNLYLDSFVIGSHCHYRSNS